MRLTVYTDYALRVLMQAALKRDELLRVAEIAESFGISRNHLSKVVHQLGVLGYLDTVRGRNGGIRLARAASEITVGQIVREFEPDFALVECFDPGTSSCRIQPRCKLKDTLHDAVAAFFGELDDVTLATLVEPRSGLQTLLHMPAATVAAQR